MDGVVVVENVLEVDGSCYLVGYKETVEDMECFVDDSRCFEVGIVACMADPVKYQYNLVANRWDMRYEENEQEAHKVAESEAGSNARWVCTGCLEHSAMAQSLMVVVVVDRILYHGAGRGVADVLALAEGAHALGMAVVLNRMSRLMAVVEGNSPHPCSSLGKPSRIE